MLTQLTRCEWCGDDPLYQHYHDHEWGIPLYDDKRLFELLILEGAQAGLSWITVLRKRPQYQIAFDNFDPEKIAVYNTKKVETLMQNVGIIRNRRKIESTIGNAQAYLNVIETGISFSDYVWQFTSGKTIQNTFTRLGEIPAETEVSRAMSNRLKKDGFRFVGPTICYAFMQATGMVNDHITGCHRYKDLRSL